MVQGLLTVTTIGEVAVEIRRDNEEKELTLKADAEKGVPDLLGSNFTYLFHIGKVSSHENLLPVWK